MGDDYLGLLGDHPLVFGIQCPWCDHEHLVVSLGATPTNEAGEPLPIEPTLGLINIDPEEEIGVVKCWECHRVFRFHFCVIIPDEVFETDVN